MSWSNSLDLKNPAKAYTAASNVEAHLIVDLLHSKGIPAHAIEDQSGVSLWMFGTISQYHKPNIWVDKPDVTRARELISEFEAKKLERYEAETKGDDLSVTCEDCGKVTTFPNSLDGTTQECKHCYAYMDVGDLPWDEDVGEALD